MLVETIAPQFHIACATEVAHGGVNSAVFPSQIPHLRPRILTVQQRKVLCDCEPSWSFEI